MNLDWNQVHGRLRPVGVFVGFVLWFRPWHTVYGPGDMPCELHTGSLSTDQSIYRYKSLGTLCYNLSMEPSPGFPGS
jgi:hypothetical protein